MDGNDVTDQFSVKTLDGKLTIEKRTVTLTSATDSKEYDGTPLTNDEVTVGGDGFAAGEGASYAVTGSQTLVGSSQNYFTYKLNAGTDERNYTITTNPGTLTVTNRDAKYEITVVANSGTEKYDGMEKTVSGFETTTFTIAGQTYTVEGLTAEAKGTNAGTYPSNVTGIPVVKDAEGNDVTSQFSVKTENGSLVIEKRDVTLTSATASKEYDGTPLTNDEVTVGGDGFAAGEGAVYTVTGSQTIVGSSQNYFTYELNAETDAENYTITIQLGTLTVTNRDAKYEITVVANSGTEKYDGTEKTVSGLVEDTFVIDGQTYTVEGLTAEAKGTDAGTYPANVTGTPVVKDADGNDVTDQFSVKTLDGKLTIEKRTVTLTSATASKPYDGTPLTNHEVTVSGDGFAAGEGASYAVTGSQTLVGSSENYFTYELNAGTDAGNYIITIQKGTLTVTNRDAKYEITIEANSDTTVYDGTEKAVSGFIATTFEIEGNTYRVEGLTAEAKETDAGTYPVNVTGTPVVKDAAGNDVTDQFSVLVVNGQLIINKREVVLRSKDLTKEYDGKPLVNGNEPLATETGWAEGEGAEYTFTGTQTLVGSSPNSFEYTLNENTKAENYNIIKSEGQLIVRDKGVKYAINVEANSAVYSYNGKEQVVEGLKATTFVTADGGTYTVEGLTAKAAATAAGSYTVEVTGNAVVRDVEGNDVTSQFMVTTTPGTLVIEKAKLVLTAGSASKLYDGKPLTAEFAESIEGVVEGERVVERELEYDGSQVEIGSSSNAIRRESVRVETTGILETLIGGEDTTANYEIQLVPGRLVVEQRYDLSYTVNRIYLDADGKETSSEVIDHSKTAQYGEVILKAEPVNEVVKDELHYVLLPDWPDYLATKDKTVGLNAEENIVNIYYALDEKGNPGEADPENPTDPIPDKEDNIPDMYQIIFKYVSAGNGTVDGKTYETHTFTDENGDFIVKTAVSPEAKVTVRPDAGYAFDYWTIDGSQKDFSAAMTQLKAETYTDDVIFTAYFAEDTKGGTDPENPDDNVPDDPDGIPDKYQTIFQYVSGGNGRVEGTTYEVHTFVEDGVYTEASRMPVHPDADVTVTATVGFRFGGWTFGDQNYRDADAIRAAEFTADATFTAMFNRIGGGGSGTGGGGGNGSTPEGGASSVIRTDDPGTTVTINPEEVPLAPLPGGEQSGTPVIPEEEAPLIGLPRTGDNSISISGLVGMMLVSLLGAFGISRKRKKDKEA